MSDLEDINETIADLATPGGITMIQQGEAPIIKGRRGVAVVTVAAVVDVVVVPDAGGVVDVVGADASIKPTERVAIYVRDEVLSSLFPPGGDAWWFVWLGKFFRVDAVEPWTPGGFWVAKAARIDQQGAMFPVWFGDGLVVDVAAMEVRQEAVAQSMVSVGVDGTGITAIVSTMTDPLTPADFRAGILNAGVIAFLNGHTAGGFNATKGNIVADAYEAVYLAYDFDVNAPTAYVPSRSVRLAGVVVDVDGPMNVLFAGDVAGPLDDPRIIADGTEVASTSEMITVDAATYLLVSTLLAAGTHTIEVL